MTEPYVLSTPQDLAASLRGSTTDFQATTALIAAIALFAGAFLIFNTLSMTVVEQVREVGLLRAAGATRRQVMRFMLSQALVIGVFGSLLGVGLGALLAAGMVAYVRTIGSVTLNGRRSRPTPWSSRVLVGIGVTLAAALEPARRAGRIQPVEALKARLDLPSARRARLRWLAVVFVVVAVVGLDPPRRGGAGIVQALARLRGPARSGRCSSRSSCRPSPGSPGPVRACSCVSRSAWPGARSSVIRAGRH